MRGYEDYYSSPDSAIDLNVMLRDILAELEMFNKRIAYLEEWNERLILYNKTVVDESDLVVLEVRIAKLEEDRKP